MRSEIHDLIRKFALQNAIRHKGKAKVQPVIGKVLANRQELRERLDELSEEIREIVETVNSMSISEQRKVLKKSWPELLEERKVKEADRVLPPLPNVENYDQVVTRFSPNPDCVLHLGSARAVILSHDYAEKYGGRFLLRFEDTDPKGKSPGLEFYEAIRKDLSWLRCEPDEEFIQSDRLPIYYDLARKILGLGYAYVCTCPRKDFRAKISEMEPCPCRSGSPELNLDRWDRMLEKYYAEGDAVVRVKTDLNHPNPAVRDWPALRMIDTEKHPHPRVGDEYPVWPLYNFACGVDDHLMGITHIIRGKEHLTNEVRQRYLYKHLGWKYPETIHYGRLRVVGSVLSKSKILAGVRSGVYTGWDDPRLATLLALKKRGIAAVAIRRIIHDVGPNPVDATLSWKTLYAYNRKVIDTEANRYFFVSNPLKMTVSGIPGRYSAKFFLHPDHEERGYRIFEVTPEDGVYDFCVSGDDAKYLLEGMSVRLIGLFNVRVSDVDDMVEATFVGESYEEARRADLRFIHWIPSDEWVKTSVLMPDSSLESGLSEIAVRGLRIGQIVQFERFGFVRVDSVGETLTVRYSHV